MLTWGELEFYHVGNNRSDYHHTRWICNDAASSIGCQRTGIRAEDWPCGLSGSVCAQRCFYFQRTGKHQCINSRQSIIENMGEQCREFDAENVVFRSEHRYIDWYEDDQRPTWDGMVQADQGSALQEDDDSFIDWEDEIIRLDIMNKIRTNSYDP